MSNLSAAYVQPAASDLALKSEFTVALDARLVCGANTGDSTYWTGLLHGLTRIEATVKFLLLSDRPKPPELQLDGRFRWITVQGRSNRWWSLVWFPLTARSSGAQVIHTQYSLSPLVRRGGVTTIHDISYLIGPEWFKPKDRMLLRAAIPGSIKRAARVFAVSETGKREIEVAYPSALGKTVVTPNACPPWIERMDREASARSVRDELGVERPFLLTVGTRWPRKNMQLAVDAADALPPELPHKLVLTGKAGWGESRLGRRGQAVGYVDARQLSCLYSAADLYLAPSRHEGFGIPLVEAFRCGCPVVCSTGGALPEVAGDAAIVEASWESGSWANTIAKLLSDPSKLDALRMRGFEREKLYTWEKTARAALGAYREVAS